jgi:hypothetical protein
VGANDKSDSAAPLASIAFRTRTERAKSLVATVKRDLCAFLSVGRALKELKDDGLFKDLGYTTFEELAAKEFGISLPYAHEHLRALEVLAPE